MTPRALFVAAAIAVLAAPASAQVSYREWLNQCSPGAIQGCVNLSLRLEYFAATNQTAISMSISNLQGLPGYKHLPPSTTGGVLFHGLSLSGFPGLIPGSTWDLGPTGSLVNGTAATGNAELDGLWGEMGWIDDDVFFAGQQQSGGVWGCTPHDGRFKFNLFWAPWTCGGAIHISWDSFHGRIDFTDQTSAELRWFMLDGAMATCRTGTTCVSVPEPGTFGLLATGLLGLVYVSRRRRAA